MSFPNSLSGLGISSEHAAEVSLVVLEDAGFHPSDRGSWSTAKQKQH